MPSLSPTIEGSIALLRRHTDLQPPECAAARGGERPGADEPDFELIIVDDSTDDTPQWLATQTDLRIKVVRPQRKSGVSGGRNHGLATARAPIVSFLDFDDFYLPQYLSRALAALDREPDVVCTLSSGIKEVRNERRPSPLPDVKLGPRAFEWALYAGLIGVDGSSITVRTKAARGSVVFANECSGPRIVNFSSAWRRMARPAYCRTCCGKRDGPTTACPTSGQAPAAICEPM